MAKASRATAPAGPPAAPADPNNPFGSLFNTSLTSNFNANPVAAGNSPDAARWYQNQGYTWTPMGWQAPRYGPYSGPQSQFGVPYGVSQFTTGSMYGTPTAYPNRALPSWMMPAGAVTNELQNMYRNVPGLFNTGPYQQAVNQSIGAISTTARNAASNAAAEYANKVRQAGGTTAAAGLVKAEGMVGAEKTVGDIRTQAAQYVLDQQEKQATLSSQIANNLGQLRNNYLSTLSGYATAEDKFSATLGAGRGAGAGGGVGTAPYNSWSTNIGAGIGHENDVTAFNPAGGLLNLGVGGQQRQTNLNTLVPGWGPTGG